jgi:hypothetical protein
MAGTGVQVHVHIREQFFVFCNPRKIALLIAVLRSGRFALQKTEYENNANQCPKRQLYASLSITVWDCFRIRTSYLSLKLRKPLIVVKPPEIFCCNFSLPS